MTRADRIGLALLGCLAAAPAHADDTHWSIGGGGYLALFGPERLGSAASVEVYPGSRLGGRLALWGLDRDEPTAQLVLGGVTYSAASARPQLHLALHADAGATVDDPDGTRAAIGGGIHTTLGLFGPLAVGFDAGAYLLVGGETELLLASATTLRLSF